MRKIYVLDTNILLQSPSAIFGFADNDIYILTTVLQELDKFKTESGERGYGAREAIRKLNQLRENVAKDSSIKPDSGIPINKDGKLYFVNDTDINYLPESCSLASPDNRIINTVIHLKRTHSCPVILVTNDISMSVNAFVMSDNEIKTQGYLNEMVSDDEQYTGKVQISVPKELIDKLYKEKFLYKDEFPKNFISKLYENEFILLTAIDNEKQSALAIYKDDNIVLINEKHLRGTGDIRGKNATQKMLMYALLASPEEIPLVIVKGPAGTGKTMLAIACGLDGTYDDKNSRTYDQVMITRTNVISDNDLGFLPGDLEEKMSPLIAPFIDNMQRIFEGQGKKRDVEAAKEQIEYLLSKEIVKICSVAYMRGRSVTNTYLIVDEAQNMTVSQALEIVSRAGIGTKIVLLGDPDQIDARYLSKRNNGLVFSSEKMKGSKLCAQITFEQEESVRSPLAMEAAKRLTIEK